MAQMVLRFHEDVDMGRFAYAWNLTAPTDIVEVDQRAYSVDQAETRLQTFLEEDRQLGSDPSRVPVSRLTIFDRGADPTVVVWSFLRPIAGRSYPIVLSDVFAAYDALVADESVPSGVAATTCPPGEQRATHDRETATDQPQPTDAEIPTPTQLVVDGIGGVDQARRGRSQARTFIDAPTTRALEGLADQSGVVLETVLEAAWSRLLSIYSRESEVAFGVTKPGPELTDPFPVAIAVPHDLDVITWLKQIRTQQQARDFERGPAVGAESEPVGSGIRQFESVLEFETESLNSVLRRRIGTGDRVGYELIDDSIHPLLLRVQGGEQLELNVDYDRSMFDHGVVERMAGHVAQILRSMAEDAAGIVGDLACLGEAERILLLETWNSDGDPHATTPTDFVTRWRERVEQTPDAVAIVDRNERMTFAELDARSDWIAGLIGEIAGPGDFVGVLLNRSIEAAASLLGALKSGAAYVPLDPEYPRERLLHMITDSGLAALVTDAATAGSTQLRDLVAGLPGVSMVVVDERDPSSVDAALPGGLVAGSPAYMIYTSGSTGKPKGVVVSHDALVNHADGVGRTYGLTASDRVLQFAALSFDVAAEEMFPTWLAGATVVLRSDEVSADFDALHEIIEQHELTVVNLPAAYWAAWVDHLHSTSGSVPSSLRLVVVGSEKVSSAHYDRWLTVAGSSVGWLNAYGPTEATITASVFDPVGADPVTAAVMPIGRPITGVSMYVLDDRGGPTPIGVPGELHIGGRGVAIGYHERAELTDDKFIPDRWARRSGGKLYRTGDLARWLPDGNVEFLGRIDDQVKVRGFRIELGEIETALCDLEPVAQAVVVNQQDSSGSDHLIAHVVTESGDTPDVEALRARLAERLPAYMVPTAIEYLPALPMTPSGKVDRGALPTVRLHRPETVKVPPRTDLERGLAQIWSELLGTTEIGVHDNFFDVGGTSLTAVRLFSSIRELTGRRLQLLELFAAPSIAELAAVLGDDGSGSEAATAEPQEAAPSWVFPVKISGSRPPLFHLGGASVLRVLADYLPEDQPLYALLEQDLDADFFYTSVEDIVEHCLVGMRSVQPEGPYLIAGLCFGGIVALEMSRRLRADGQEVAMTLMIDSFAPGALATLDGNPVADEHDEATSLLAKLDALPDLGRVLYKARGRAWRLAWNPLHSTHRRLGKPMPAWLRDVEEANTVAAAAYNRDWYGGDVTLFRATGNPEQLYAGPDNGWTPLIGGTLVVREVEGGHVSMYEEPAVAGLAATMTEALDKALGSAQR